MDAALKQHNTDLFGDPLDALPPRVAAAVELLSRQGDIESRGGVYTRPEVVDFILDLAGYTSDQPLHMKRVLEPSFGGGEFLFACIGRLLIAWKASKSDSSIVDDLSDAIRAVELHRESFSLTRERIIHFLQAADISPRAATALADAWLVQGDFLLTPFAGTFDTVIGNPPYVRQERVPAPLLAEYRKRYPTLYDRADLYVPFIERSLRLLSDEGVLGFICADRWMKNRYGGPLRNFVAKNYHLDVFVDMVDTPAFTREVSTYPAITIISRKKRHATRVAFRPLIDRDSLSALAAVLQSKRLPAKGSPVHEQSDVATGDQPWLFDATDKAALLRRIEQTFPTLEEAACKVGIGVATGADKAFIGMLDGLDVEPSRKLPLATTRDIQSGEVCWCGQGVINPYADDGSLVDLHHYPRLRRYLEERKDVIAKRHCAQKTPTNWYRTIDRIQPELAIRPKLLIPDIKGAAHIVFESGKLYPHHNLYYVVSDTWDLRALQAVLLSDIVRLTMTTYSTQMRGGYLRFQAQYLRRIHIPLWQDVPETLRLELADAAKRRDLAACNRAASKLYSLTESEQALLNDKGEPHGT
jgi:hypothetical protein